MSLAVDVGGLVVWLELEVLVLVLELVLLVVVVFTVSKELFSQYCEPLTQAVPDCWFD